ncbi:ATP-binding protein [Botryobacter ruber]|uniref:ATP-binding protein n=1 Tax=Botryobacter ruber TaxID=2171629 RepID=UPI001F0BEC11|nr:ATP-binding protein [Botryobacter ruber]
MNTEPDSYPDLLVEADGGPLDLFLREHPLNIEEYIILLLALMPHLQPNFLENIVLKYLPQGGDFPEMGGVKGASHRGMLPTGETVQFILAGDSLADRLRITRYFSSDHFFYRHQILSLEPVKEGEPRMSGRIILAQEFVEWLTLGKVSAPAFSPEFPAKKIETAMDWNDLVLRPATCGYIDDIKMWLQHHRALAADPVIARKLRRGYRALFYGPPGTGKTLTASLLGKQFNKEVYRIDLSQVVSKYIGETEKNLEKIFAKAENKEWILFFDEADALFGKRSSVSSAHDKYANQEVSYLLQRVEDFPGLIILASNFKNNIDQAFIRRFNAILHFPMPDAAERLAIWQKNLPATIPVHEEVSIQVYANKHEFSGSAITNIMQYASLCALSRPEKTILNDDIVNGIKRELIKEDKF